MQSSLISFIVSSILKVLPPEAIRGALLKLIEYLENKVIRTENTIDDEIVLPLVAALRKALSLPAREVIPNSDSEPAQQ